MRPCVTAQPGPADRIADCADDRSTCPATIIPIAVFASKPSDFSGLANLAKPAPQGIESLDRRFPANAYIGIHAAAIDPKIAAIPQHFPHFAQRGVEIG